MARATYHVHTIAFGYDERSDWAIQTYLNAEAENSYLLDRVILTEPDSPAQKYRHWVIVTKLIDSGNPEATSDSRIGDPAETPGIS